jgi:exopolyphosphatase/guanosine-5'-triphosphate,3'-diphosphate pyrophosphatase
MGPVAVVDVGSNSARVVVLRVGPGGHLEAIADGRAPLRLALDLSRHGRLQEASIVHATAALRDFRALAEGAGADRILAVATSAVREAPNAADLVDAFHKGAGIDLTVIDGDREALLSFRGAASGLPVEDGLMMDLGGGSVELTRFRERRPVRARTLPIGSLRLSDEFLIGDPPSAQEMAALSSHVRDLMKASGVEPLDVGERMIATGGTVRNLAKIDRHSRTYPVPRLHGYVLTGKRMQDLVRLLASRKLARRRRVAGLNADRADSVVGGALVALVTMETLGAGDFVVAGQGLREGVALEALGHEPLPIPEMRRSSVRAIVARFASWDAERAERRSTISLALQEVAWPDAGQHVRECLEHAAVLLDVGRSVDYYRRFDHTADVVLEGDLAGFSHRTLALLSAVVRAAGDDQMRVGSYRPLLTADDRAPVARAAAILALADAVEHRLAPGAVPDHQCSVVGRRVVLRAPVFDPWEQESLGERFRRAFGRRLTIIPPGAPGP